MRFDDHEGLRPWMIVGEGEMNGDLVACRGQFFKPRRRAAGQARAWARREGALTTPISFMNTPRLKPVPTALENASLAAKRLA